jgi:hypothetical protein
MALLRYSSASFSTASGVGIANGATITVRVEASGSLASIYSDRDGATPKSNPFTADSKGRFDFFVEPIDEGFEVSAVFGAETTTVNNVLDLIPFTPSGSGAVPSSVQEKLRNGVPVDVKSDYDAAGDGTTDDTTAFQGALDDVGDAGGGIVLVPEGTYILSHITVPSNTILQGVGQGTILKHKASASDDLIELDDPTSTVRAHLRDFSIDGNKASQLSAVRGVNIDNTGSSGLIPRHRVENLFVYNCKAVGVRLGALAKETIFHNINCYSNDTNGFELTGADSQISNCISGQSGDDGFRISGSSLMMSNCKSWFSGRLTAGSAGFLFRNSENIIGSGLHAQENSGPGFSLFGQSGALQGHVLQGIADSDNTAGSTHAGWNLNNVDGAIICAKTTVFSGAAGTPNYGMSISSNTTNCKIILNSDGQNSFALNGGGNDNANDITVNNCGRTIKANVGDAAATLTPGASEETQVWNTTLTQNRVVTLATSNAWAGCRFKIVRTSEATGSFNLAVGQTISSPTSALANLSVGEWCEVTFDGTSWVLTGFGSLS